MFDAMWNPQVGIFGIPAGNVLLMIVQAWALLGGFIWMRRLAGDDQKVESFRATASQGRRPTLRLIAGLVMLGAALI